MSLSTKRTWADIFLWRSVVAGLRDVALAFNFIAYGVFLAAGRFQKFTKSHLSVFKMKL